jgi:hypothetical protein
MGKNVDLSQIIKKYKEYMNHEYLSLVSSNLESDIWSGVGRVGHEIKVVNAPEVMSLNPRALVVLCPLYAQGDLKDSKLIGTGAKIEDSRVAGKLTVYKDVVGALHAQLLGKGGGLELTCVFANKGILYSGEPSVETEEDLVYHEALYRQDVGEFCDSLAVSCQFETYETLGVNFPKFVGVGEQAMEGVRWGAKGSIYD